MDRVILIDAKNLAYRIHATHGGLSSNGFPTGVLYGVPVAMMSLAKKFPGAPLVFIWDGDGTTWRHRLLTRGKSGFQSKLGDAAHVKGDLPPYMQASVDWMKSNTAPFKRPPKPKPAEKPVGYKANRSESRENFIDAARQLPILKAFLTKLGVRQFEFNNLEGDDLMGVMVTHIEDHNIFDQTIIYSGDKDFYQFITKKTVVLRSEKQGGFADVEDIQNDFGVGIENYTRLRAITGDPSDNIPHLFAGVGPKTAARWINAGLNPELDKWILMPLQVREVLKDINAKYDLEGRWDEIHTNYLVSEIVRKPSHPFLSDRLRLELSKMLAKVSRGYLLADRRTRNDETWRWLNDYLAKYEMNELLARRQELWQIP